MMGGEGVGSGEQERFGGDDGDDDDNDDYETTTTLTKWRRNEKAITCGACLSHKSSDGIHLGRLRVVDSSQAVVGSFFG